MTSLKQIDKKKIEALAIERVMAEQGEKQNRINVLREMARQEGAVTKDYLMNKKRGI